MAGRGARLRGRAAPAAGRALGWAAGAGIPMAFFALFFAVPVLAMLSRGFTGEHGLDLGGFGDVFSRGRTWRIIGTTLALGLAGTAGSVLLGVPGAYILYRRRFPGRAAVRALATVPFVLPTVVVGVAFRALLAESGPLGFLGMDGSFWAIVASLVFFNYSVVVRTVGGMWERLDPRTEQAARALGASPVRAFWHVTLPALTPSIASAAALVFLFCSTAFGVVLVLGGLRYGTVETEIWVQTTQFLDLRTASVLSIVQLAVVALALTVSGITRSRHERALAMVGDSILPPRLRLRADCAPAAVTAFTLLGLALPIVHLVVASLRARGQWSLDSYRALATTGGPNALSVSVWEAAENSLRVAVDATVIAMVIGTLVAVVVSRRPRSRGGRRGVQVLDAVFMLPLGVSAVTVGFGFLIALNRPPLDLRSSLILIPIAQAVVAIPLVVRTIVPVLRAIDPRLREAAAVLGASPARVLWHVDRPYLMRALGLGIGFAFAVSLGEFGATSFLARPDRPTLPVVIARLIGRPGVDNYGMALAAAVVLALITAGIMTGAERLRGDRAGEI